MTESLYGRKEDGKDFVVFWRGGQVGEEGDLLMDDTYVEIAIEKERVQALLDQIARDPEHFHQPALV